MIFFLIAYESWRQEGEALLLREQVSELRVLLHSQLLLDGIVHTIVISAFPQNQLMHQLQFHLATQGFITVAHLHLVYCNVELPTSQKL